jgi:hypothetical protein
MNALLYDYGLFCSLAERLARDFDRVAYFVPWETSFADGRELLIGEGLKGVERVKYFDDVVDDFELLIFPDVQSADLQEYYRKQGRRVWGSGKASELELLRWKTKQRHKELGLPVNECHKIHGISALRAFFISTPCDDGWFVKISGLRGLGETWCAHDYSEAKGILDDFESKFCPICYLVDFIVERGIPDCKEIGYDGYWVAGQFPESSLWGIEKKDKCYFGVVSDYADMPQGVRTVNDALSGVVSKEFPHCANFFSTEIREKDGIPYPIDYTCRHASPAGECVVENMTNLAEVIMAGAEGQLVQPQWSGKFCAQIILCADWAEDKAEIVNFPEEIRQWVKLYNHCRVDDGGELGMRDYFVPQVAKMKQIGSVVAIGDDAESTAQLCKDRAAEVKGFDLEAEDDALDEAVEELTELLKGE